MLDQAGGEAVAGVIKALTALSSIDLRSLPLCQQI
jgi:hypothetical protein